MKLLVFDVGGTEMKYALAQDALTFLHRGILPTPTESFDRFLSTVCEISQKYKDEAEGIAMALPGPVDTGNGLCFRNGANLIGAFGDRGGISFPVKQAQKNSGDPEFSFLEELQ